MKDEQYYMDKFRNMAEQFKKAYWEKKYGLAKHLYDTALKAAEFLELDKQHRTELFGNAWCYEEDGVDLVTGLFSKEIAEKAYKECVMKLYQSYENESYRRYGQAPQYYPYPRYPVPGYENVDK